MTSLEKLEKLKNIISSFNSIAIAFSGGVDSTLLARVCTDILPEKSILLITATSCTYPFYELDEAVDLAKSLNLKHKVIVSEETDIPGFTDNTPERCYFCKKELFTEIKELALKEGIETILDGSNYDDRTDFRPGRKALKELGIKSPLFDAQLCKKEIRELSRMYKLPTSEKPAYACLASRFPYGEKITKEKLERVGTAEQEIRNMGFTQFRVRSHDSLARLEFIPDEMEKAWDLRNNIEKVCKNAGFNYISIDLKGYRTGAMNEVLKKI
jgi:pyridinium-3,5-biscarboxylic acid mononucleotide sulfurtransferase